MRRNKDKYPHLPSEFTDKQIELAVANAGSIEGAAKRLGVCYRTLYGALNKRGTGTAGSGVVNVPKALAAMDRIEASNLVAEMIMKERRVLAGAMGAARARTRLRTTEGSVA